AENAAVSFRRVLPCRSPTDNASIRFDAYCLRRAFLHRERVDGLSPSEGSAKARETGPLLSDRFASRRTSSGYGSLYGTFRSRTPSERSSFQAIAPQRSATGGNPQQRSVTSAAASAAPTTRSSSSSCASV